MTAKSIIKLLLAKDLAIALLSAPNNYTTKSRTVSICA
ncbi:hypothetical protein EYZ11_002109 [Aspergillus tanneri]|uniref:Uncharacterized protein n=1 Tax=Aspergillus tanneri TaxID=1220188 RepID=A0A4S3JSC0_9EURO|nr:hypothetical protein EYZ11_002109 [Aspergillus tanneri]